MIIDCSKIETRGVIIDAEFKDGLNTRDRQFLSDCNEQELRILCAFLIRGVNDIQRKFNSAYSSMQTLTGQDDDL